MQPRFKDRLGPAIGAAVMTGLMGLALVAGLGWSRVAREQVSLALFEVPPSTLPPLPKPRVVSPQKPVRKAGAASPPNVRSAATEIVAPPPVIPPIVPPPVVAALTAGSGRDAMTGAAEVRGPGTGSGGQDNGSGNGDAGDGDGDGGDGGIPPRHVRGRLKDSDYPAAAGGAGIGGTVAVRYLVGSDGRVSECEVTRSSGSLVLDQTTCKLIRERFRFKPSRDGRGNPVPSYIVEKHSWIVHDEPEEE